VGGAAGAVEVVGAPNVNGDLGGSGGAGEGDAPKVNGVAAGAAGAAGFSASLGPSVLGAAPKVNGEEEVAEAVGTSAVLAPKLNGVFIEAAEAAAVVFSAGLAPNENGNVELDAEVAVLPPKGNEVVGAIGAAAEGEAGAAEGLFTVTSPPGPVTEDSGALGHPNKGEG